MVWWTGASGSILIISSLSGERFKSWMVRKQIRPCFRLNVSGLGWGRNPPVTSLSNNVLSTVLLEDGTSKSNPDRVPKACKEFYQNLYHKEEENLTSIEEIEGFVPDLDLPSLSDEETASLDSPLTRDELGVALGKLNSNKCPGTDRLPPEFYTQFWELLAPHLCRSIFYSISSGTLSAEQRCGIITLVPKKKS